MFDKELGGFHDHVASIVIGDMNVHNEDWLRYSNGSFPEGRELEQVCSLYGLKQRVKLPTRGDHLLDLVLTDIAGVKCDVAPGVLDSDHRATIASFDISVPRAPPSSRVCFDTGKAK